VARRQLLTEEERRLLFGLPTDRDTLARPYTFTRPDLDLIAGVLHGGEDGKRSPYPRR